PRWDRRSCTRGAGAGAVGAPLPPAGPDLTRLADGVGVGPHGERDHVSVEAVDHRARLGAGAAVRLLDGERGAGLLLVLRDEGRVDVAPQLARRVVGPVEQLEGRGPA